MKAKVVKVNILGQDYVVRSSAGQKYLEQVAKYVDKKMEEIKASGIDDSQQLRIAILAAMNITDELFTYKKEKKKFVDKVEAKTIAITEFIENRIHDIEEAKKSFGYCIKSKREIRFNQKITFSIVEWDKIPRKDRGNPSGNYCHRCGKEVPTSRNNPLCNEHK